jgi:hypothetical protein
MGRTEEDFDNIAGGALAVGQAADDFGNGLRRLQASVTSENPWGADEPGTVFGMAYTALLGHAMETYGSHLELLVAGAEKLVTWADNSRSTEDHNAELASRPDPSSIEV